MNHALDGRKQTGVCHDLVGCYQDGKKETACANNCFQGSALLEFSRSRWYKTLMTSEQGL